MISEWTSQQYQNVIAYHRWWYWKIVFTLCVGCQKIFCSLGKILFNPHELLSFYQLQYWFKCKHSVCNMKTLSMKTLEGIFSHLFGFQWGTCWVFLDTMNVNKATEERGGSGCEHDAFYWEIKIAFRRNHKMGKIFL